MKDKYQELWFDQKIYSEKESSCRECDLAGRGRAHMGRAETKPYPAGWGFDTAGMNRSVKPGMTSSVSRTALTSKIFASRMIAQASVRLTFWRKQHVSALNPC